MLKYDVFYVKLHKKDVDPDEPTGSYKIDVTIKYLQHVV